MLSNQHPLAKTSQDIRRAIARLETFETTNPEEAWQHKVTDVLINLRLVRATIPLKFIDLDLKEDKV